MDTAWLLDGLDYDAPMTLGGCRCGTASFECCEYNVFVLDDERRTDELRIDGRTVLVHHDSIDAPSSGTFAHIPSMRIIRDESWSVMPKIAAAKKSRANAFRHATKSSLVDARMLAYTARALLESGRPDASLWTKCAAYKIADAISYHNMIEPGGAHMMSRLREIPISPPNDALSVVYECLGLERATPSLLGRMSKSVVAYAKMSGMGEIAAKTVEQKAEHLASSSLLPDCHYYIGRIACALLSPQRARAAQIPVTELYAPKIALDPDSNAQHMSSHLAQLVQSADTLTNHI